MNEIDKWTKTSWKWQLVHTQQTKLLLHDIASVYRWAHLVHNHKCSRGDVWCGSTCGDLAKSTCELTKQNAGVENTWQAIRSYFGSGGFAQAPIHYRGERKKKTVLSTLVHIFLSIIYNISSEKTIFYINLDITSSSTTLFWMRE